MQSLLLDSAPPTRQADFEIKHRRVCEFLEDHGYHAVILSTPASFAWFTSGGDNTLPPSQATCAALFVSRDKYICLALEPHAQRIRDEQLAGLPIELEAIPWATPLADVVKSLVRELKAASEDGIAGTTPEPARLARLRYDLTRLERFRYRELGRALSHAVEATCRSVSAGLSESEVAGELGHRLLKHDLSPIEITIAADDRIARYARPTYGQAKVRKRAWVSAVARKHGLCAGTSRTVCVAELDRRFVKDFKLASMVAGACIFYARPGRSVSEVMRRVVRCYDQMQKMEEFLRADPGCLTGYEACEMPLLQGNKFELCDPSAIHWRPVVGTAASSDTILVDSLGFEIVTSLQKWPQLQVEVGGHQVDRPDLLMKD
jgi:Xaa-Pro dipeptidase